MRRTPRRPWTVRHGRLIVRTEARTPGGAAARARRLAAAMGRAVPYRTTPEGGWEGVAVFPGIRAQNS